MTAPDDKAMPLWRHLEELRWRLVRVVAAYALAFAVCAYFAEDIFRVLRAPLASRLNPDFYFIATTPLSGWLVYVKVALLAALLLVAPHFLFEVLSFAAPGLKRSEKRSVLPAAALMSVFFYGGLAFAYFLVLPAALGFLSGLYDGSGIKFLPDIENYFAFATATLFGFGALFLLPFLVAGLVAGGIVTGAQFAKARPFVYVAAFVVGAILTPPDVASQLMMAVPFIVLFEFGLLIGKAAVRGKRTV